MTSTISSKIALQWGISWVLLCLAFAVNLFDEAIHHFLALYNPIVLSVHGQFSLLPPPTSHFQTWLTVLVIVIVALLALSIYAFQASRWMRPLSYLFAIVMMVNGLLHIAGSIIVKAAIPGVITSPLILLAAGYLLIIARKTKT